MEWVQEDLDSSSSSTSSTFPSFFPYPQFSTTNSLFNPNSFIMNAAVTNVSHSSSNRIKVGLDRWQSLTLSFPNPSIIFRTSTFNPCHLMQPPFFNPDGLHVWGDAGGQTYSVWRQSRLSSLCSYLLRFSSTTMSLHLLLLFNENQAKERFDGTQIRRTQIPNVSRTWRIGHHHQ